MRLEGKVALVTGATRDEVASAAVLEAPEKLVVRAAPRRNGGSNR